VELPITKITRVSNLGATPARVNHETGEMLINTGYIGYLSKEEWLFVMLHETGHLVCRARDEITPDAWAFQQYAAMGYSLKKSVYAMTEILNEKNPEHLWRMYLQLKRAEAYDCQHNGNCNFKKQ
jgi:Zn-dependent protease with chaperone function